jgi:hypothetical protein
MAFAAPYGACDGAAQPDGLVGGRVPAEEAATPAELTLAITRYLSEHPEAAILEDGRVLFDMRLARYSVNEGHGRCVLQVWSEERNVVRSVVGLRHRANSLRLMTRKMGLAKPVAMELVASRDWRTPTARETARRQYMRMVERVLQRGFPGWFAEGMRVAADLEHSFGPAYVRGELVRGPAADAVIAVSGEESAAMIDGVLTMGILWLEHCRERSGNGGARSRHFGGLKVIVPAGAWRTTASRMAWLNAGAASFALYSLDERSEELTPIELGDAGNAEVWLVHAFDAANALGRAKCGIERVWRLIPEGARERAEVRARSASEVGLSLHGLEFARIRQQAAKHSFAHEEEITFGAGANETKLTDESEPLCRALLERLFLSRYSDGMHTDPLFRMQPERWLESRLRVEIGELLPDLRGEFFYTQVPAISSGDRGMLDLLTLDRAGRLAVVEVKANEDMHLPLQGLDYWIHVRALNADRKREGNRELGAFERQGYFAGAEISVLPPRLLLVAPALRIHPTNETVLRYLSPEVEWELVAISEHWRRELKVLHRKRPEKLV